MRYALAIGRKLVCGMMALVLPVSVAAQDMGRAMLHAEGGTWLNGSPSPTSSAIFPDDLIQTEANHVAQIDAYGSTVTVQAETVVQFRGDELVLDHGTLLVNTARGMKVQINCLTVIPVHEEWTQYDVTDVDGKVTVVAHRNDVNIHAQKVEQKPKPGTSNDVTVREGETATRDEHCPAVAMLPGAIDAKGAILNDWWVRGLGMAAVGAIVCKAFCFGGSEPVSPYSP